MNRLHLRIVETEKLTVWYALWVDGIIDPYVLTNKDCQKVTAAG